MMLPPLRSAVPLTVRLVSAAPEPTEPSKVVTAAVAVRPKAPSTLPSKVIALPVRRSLVLRSTGPW